MRLGLIARADNSGLGIQTYEFYRHMKPDKTMVVDIGMLNGNKSYPERYGEDAVFVQGFPKAHDVDEFLKDLDVVFIAEAAYTPYLYVRAKQLGVKTANQYNYEFFDWYVAPPEQMPDLFIAPSRWHYEDVDNFIKRYNTERGTNIGHVYLHCPVAREMLPQKEIKRASTFLHMGGRSAAYDRNGTETVIEASRLLKSNAKIFIHFQGEQGLSHQATRKIGEYKIMRFNRGDPSKVAIHVKEYHEYNEAYRNGDVMLLPRRYGGNCLPMNEALSSGMPVIMTDISPNNQFLPNNWLIPASEIGTFDTRPSVTIDMYGANPQALADKIDQFYNMSTSEMWFENIEAGKLAETVSWQTLAPKYREELQKLCNQS